MGKQISRKATKEGNIKEGGFRGTFCFYTEPHKGAAFSDVLYSKTAGKIHQSVS
jgi:hypothetical protein